MQRVHRVDRVEQARALLQPLRARLLRLLLTPTSAASLARTLGETAPKVHYHLKELERLALVRRAGHKRRGNLVETLYEARAQSFWIAPEVVSLVGTAVLPAVATRPAAAVAVALRARVRLDSDEERRAFRDDWRKLVAKYAPRRADPSPRDHLFEAVALCVPAPGSSGRKRMDCRAEARKEGDEGD